MSQVTIIPGRTIRMDPSDKKVLVFDFDALNLPSGVELSSQSITITAIRQSGGTALTNDNAALVTGNRKVSTRLLATTATRGDKYRVSCKGTTNESPAQEKEYSVFVVIEDK